LSVGLLWVVVTMLSDDELGRIFCAAVPENHYNSAGLRAVEAAVRADQIEKDAQIAAGDHRPTGYGIGALNSGSRSQWYSRGRDQAGDAIRAQLKGAKS